MHLCDITLGEILPGEYEALWFLLIIIPKNKCIEVRLQLQKNPHCFNPHTFDSHRTFLPEG